MTASTAAGGDAPFIEARYRLSVLECAAAIARLVGHSRSMRVIGAVLVLTSILPISRGEPYGWIGLVLGVTMATGFVMVPVVWSQARARADRFGTEITLRATDRGIQYASRGRSQEDPWSGYRSVRTDDGLFALLTADGSTRLVPAAAFDAAGLAAFRVLLDERVLARDRSPGA